MYRLSHNIWTFKHALFTVFNHGVLFMMLLHIFNNIYMYVLNNSYIYSWVHKRIAIIHNWAKTDDCSLISIYKKDLWLTLIKYLILRTFFE